MEKAKLDEILALHSKWRNGEPEGRRADLSGADLSGADLSGADLYGANLSGADLSGADLSGADLSGANLRSADLCGAYLYGANLRSANLRSANLSGANLSGADLRSANLEGANLRSADLRSANLRSANLSGANLGGANLGGANLGGCVLPAYQIPQEGDMTVWKKVQGGVAKLLIPADAKRTASLIGRKCRAEFVKVLEIIGDQEVYLSQHNKKTVYKAGEIVCPDKYDDDPRIECTSGIHFFLTREEAEQW